MVDLVDCLTFFFGIPLLYYNINLRASIVFCLSSGDTYFSLGIFYHAHFYVISNPQPLSL